MEANQKIQAVKSFITMFAFAHNWNNDSKREMADEAQSLIEQIAIGSFGLATEIAQSVKRFKKVSEKQAYWIAKSAVESGIANRVDYLFS
jgi:ATP-dependent protease ClpP protease subunit